MAALELDVKAKRIATHFLRRSKFGQLVQLKDT